MLFIGLLMLQVSARSSSIELFDAQISGSRSSERAESDPAASTVGGDGPSGGHRLESDSQLFEQIC